MIFLPPLLLLVFGVELKVMRRGERPPQDLSYHGRREDATLSPQPIFFMAIDSLGFFFAMAMLGAIAPWR